MKDVPKIIFFGTPSFAAGILRSLISNKYHVVAVITQPDKKIGRKQTLSPSAVKIVAGKNNIKIFQPESLKGPSIAEEIRKIAPDLFVVAAYGKILPNEILEIPKFGAINVHASLLPKYRGASPVHCAVLSGDEETGITLMRMNEKMDEGDILDQEKISIEKNETTDLLLKRLEKLGAKMIVELVPKWISGEVGQTAQNHKEATYCQPIHRSDGKIDWKEPAKQIFQKWLAYFPWPGIYAFWETKRVKLVEIKIAKGTVEDGALPGKIIEYNKEIAVQTKKDLIVLKKIQVEGKKEMTASEYARGNQRFVGSRLQ